MFALRAEHSVGHYENFPVASWLLPKRYRAPVGTLYRFARTADDLVDEGDEAPAIKLSRLNAFLSSFHNALHQPIDINDSKAGEVKDREGDRDHAITAPMAMLCQQGLPSDYPLALLDAFRQDVQVNFYRDINGVLDYATRSANPVGRSLLYFFNRHHEQALVESDAVCTALQLINFWQDVAVDWQKNRLYLPINWLIQFSVIAPNALDQPAQSAEKALSVIGDYVRGAPINADWRALMRHAVDYASSLMHQGAPLPRRIGGRAGFELQVVMEGGLRILEKINRVQGDVFRHRPKLTKRDGPRLLWRATKRWSAQR